MNLRLTFLAAIVAMIAVPAFAKAPNNPDWVQARKDVAAARIEAAPPITATVGDADSFNRHVKYIGLISTGFIYVLPDCSLDSTGPLGPEDHCVVTTPAPALTNFTINDAGRMLIPAKTANSLFCHNQTSIVTYSFGNDTGVYQPNARIQLTPNYTIQNAALNDPSMIDPTTGLPFNGQFNTSLAGIRHARSLQPDEHQTERDNTTRACIAGLVSKQNLRDNYGLTDAQIKTFFNSDTVITMNLVGQAQLIDFATINYGTRFYGDER
jgi:hypothetical protein